LKEWFKYGIGYVNIDDEYIYISNSGNWGDCQRLKEKSKVTNRAATGRQMFILSFIIIVGLVALSAWLFNTFEDIRFYFLVTPGPIMIYFLFKYMRREIGPAFKIPREKIGSIVIAENSIQFVFANGDDKNISHTVYDIPENGHEIIKMLLEANPQWNS
jgi:hypothetical protein